MKYKKAAIRIFSVVLIASTWEFIAWKIGLPAIFPSLGELFRQLFSLFKTAEFYLAVGTSICRAFVGLLTAFIISFLSGTLSAFSPFWNVFFRPIILTLRSVPVISFVLLALLWLSPEGLPIFIALITAFPVMHQNISTALRQTDKRLVEMAKVFGKSRLNRFISIYLPASKNMIYDGAGTAAGFAWRAIIVGEALAQPLHGIGSGMKEAQAFIQVPKLMAWTVVAITVSYLFEYLLQQMRKIKFSTKLPLARTVLVLPETKERTIKEISINKLNKRFGQDVIFKDCTLRFSNKTINCIKGLSGQGKTTLLRMIAGLDKNYTGTISYPPSLRLSCSFQENRLLPWLNIQDNIAYALNNKEYDRQYVSDLVSFLLEKLHLSGQAGKYPHELSGGQQQRVNLGRALAAQADILLLDEPLTGMDESLKKEIIPFIREWSAACHPIVIWATHENIAGVNNINLSTCSWSEAGFAG